MFLGKCTRNSVHLLYKVRRRLDCTTMPPAFADPVFVAIAAVRWKVLVTRVHCWKPHGGRPQCLCKHFRRRYPSWHAIAAAFLNPNRQIAPNVVYFRGWGVNDGM